MADDPIIELVLRARDADLPGGLHVRRALPQARRRAVGPFVLVDQMGPAALESDREIAVLAHPHIGLATVTYLFAGEGLHRDSLGTVQRILPGEVNWMTAGSGIVHSERMRPGASGRLFGVQTWVALPLHLEGCPPSFDHYEAPTVPMIDEVGFTARVIAGSLFGQRSDVVTSSPLFYAEVRMRPRSALALTPEHEERAVFVLEGEVKIGATKVRDGEIAVLRAGAEAPLVAEQPATILLFGGPPLDAPRLISWNFVASSKKRIDRAADAWKHLRFARIPGETKYIPLPEDSADPVDYP